MNPLPVSVVIPAYNCERYIAEALASVSAQTRQPAQVLVVDDGSTDETARIASERGATVIRQRNGGVSQARNAGIKSSTQPWIALLDADDRWLPDKLELQWESLGLCPQAGFCFGDWEVCTDQKVAFSFSLQRLPSYLAVERKATGQDLACCERRSLAARHLEANFIATSTLMIRKDLLHEVGLFDPRLQFAEDRELQMRLMAVATAAVVERPIMRYRLHGSSASADPVKMWAGRCAVGDKVQADPSRYPEGAPAHYRVEQPLLLRKAGLHLISVGRFADASAMLADSLRRQRALQTFAAFAAARFLMLPGGRTVHQATRAAWKALKLGTGSGKAR